MTDTPLRIFVEHNFLTPTPSGLISESLGYDADGGCWLVRHYADGQWTRLHVVDEARALGYLGSRI